MVLIIRTSRYNYTFYPAASPVVITVVDCIGAGVTVIGNSSCRRLDLFPAAQCLLQVIFIWCGPCFGSLDDNKLKEASLCYLRSRRSPSGAKTEMSCRCTCHLEHDTIYWLRASVFGAFRRGKRVRLMEVKIQDPRVNTGKMILRSFSGTDFVQPLVNWRWISAESAKYDKVVLSE